MIRLAWENPEPVDTRSKPPFWGVLWETACAILSPPRPEDTLVGSGSLGFSGRVGMQEPFRAPLWDNPHQVPWLKTSELAKIVLATPHDPECWTPLQAAAVRELLARGRIR